MLLDFHSEIFSWIRGGLLVLFSYHLLIYFQNGRKLYLYYSLFLLGLFIYFLRDVIDPDLSKRVFSYINFSIQFLSYAAFTMFARKLLETKEKLIFWDKVLRFEAQILLGLSLLFPIMQFFFGYEYQIKLFLIISPILTIVTLVMMYFLWKIPGATSKYFVIGTLVYSILANISFAGFFIGQEIFERYKVEPMFFVYAGAILQSLIYASILGRSIKKIEQKSKNAEVRLAFKYKELEELKMTALQSQMNPHFLFNSLNSINNFILKSDIEKASDYITKFSRLIRVILKSSSSLTVPFSEELGILSLYVKLEQMRINGGFEYIVNIDETINLEEIKVPPLFLQPFIENSIWHGLTHVEGEKRILLTINKQGNDIICEIIDNGIGINKAREEAHKKINRRKFFGTQATENRIRLLYKKANVQINVTDISDKTSTGTKVRIIFPRIIKR
ncbi:MAG: histidine kinase [Flavobacteriaceae bacterium]|nr:histidine kinase [Flavobacteriaceae bacterium]